MQRIRLALSCLLLVAVFLFLQFRSYGDSVAIRKPLGEFPATLGDWRVQEFSAFDDKTLKILKLNDYANLRYADKQGRSVWLYIGYWDSQRKGAQIHSPKNCLPGSGWEPVQATRLTIPLQSPDAPIEVNSYLLQKDRQQQLVLYWYQSQGIVNNNEIAARIQMVKSSIFLNRSDGAIVRISSPVYGNVVETRDLLTRYVQSLYPVLENFLPR